MLLKINYIVNHNVMSILNKTFIYSNVINIEKPVKNKNTSSIFFVKELSHSYHLVIFSLKTAMKRYISQQGIISF